MYLCCSLTGCDIFYKEQFNISQVEYDFGLSEVPWVFQVWKKETADTPLFFSVDSSEDWIICQPKTGSTSGPNDRKSVAVRVNRFALSKGTHEGTIEVTSLLSRTKRIKIKIYISDEEEKADLHLTNVTRQYSSPYLLDYTFNIRDRQQTPIIAEPGQFQFTCLENGVRVSASETGARLALASTKQMKCVLLMDYTASVCNPANGDVNQNGLADTVEEMEYGVKELFLPSLSEDTQVAIMEFHREKPPGMVAGFTSDKQYLKTRVDAIRSEYVAAFPGPSRCWDAMALALAEFRITARSEDESRNIVIITDGRDESSYLKPEQVLAVAKELGVRVYAIGMGKELDVSSLVPLTYESAGTLQVAETREDITKAFEEVLQDIYGQYTVRWATLKRGIDAFLPTFGLVVAGKRAVYTASQTYRPLDHAGNVLLGNLRMVESEGKGTTPVYLRVGYLPRYVREFRMYLRSPYKYKVRKVAGVDGGLCESWNLSVEPASADTGVWITLASPDPDDLGTSLPFAAFGPLLRFDVAKANDGSPAFDIVYLDNDIYAGRNQQFVFEE
jgi:hypothetical protein